MAFIHLGYFEDFKSSNTVLIEGDQEGFRLLEQALRLLAKGEMESLIIHELLFVKAHKGVKLFAFRGPRDFRVSGNGVESKWERTGEGWEEAADKIAAVYQSGAPCHHYLDAPKDQYTVMVSGGEYNITVRGGQKMANMSLKVTLRAP